jgi:hypothetical protein
MVVQIGLDALIDQCPELAAAIIAPILAPKPKLTLLQRFRRLFRRRFDVIV